MKLPSINLLLLEKCPIYKQLQIEEALLRLDSRNWCIINEQSPPAIVMGISGNPDILLNRPLLQKHPIPVIRRFSGGGTVVVDEQTLFVTFICNKESVQVPCYPDQIHNWAEKVYQGVFPNDFRLVENDYVLGNRKFGGNAQYLRKDRWLHHSSLLWDFNPNHMDYLLLPPKMPFYREKRSHNDFLCRLADHHPRKDIFYNNMNNALKYHFEVHQAVLGDIVSLLDLTHRQATAVIEI